MFCHDNRLNYRLRGGGWVKGLVEKNVRKNNNTVILCIFRLHSPFNCDVCYKMFSKYHSIFIYSDKMRDLFIKSILKTITIKWDGNLKAWDKISVVVGNIKFCYKQWE